MARRLVSAATNSRGVGFLRRKTNPFMKRKENNMIIARAAKGAALLLMIFGVVALIGCQGATAGPKGDKGDPGAAGEPGAAGPQGPAGISALQAKDGGTHTVVINNTGTGDARDKLGDLANPSSGSLDASTYFSGGRPALTYAGRNLPESGTFKVAVDMESGMITLSKRTASQEAPIEADYTTGTSFIVRATDADSITRDVTVTVRTNRPPIRCHGDNPCTATDNPDPGTGDDLPVLPLNSHTEHPNFAFVVGTQAELAAVGSITAKPALNQFWADDRTGATVPAQSGRIGVRGRAPGAGDQISPYFMDDDPRDVKISITEVGAAGTADDNEYIMATVEEDGDLMVTGLKSTWVEDSCTHSRGDCNQAMNSDPVDAHVPVRVELTATDAGGLTAKTWIYVWVDGTPAVVTENTFQANYVIKKSDGATSLIDGLHEFFEDPEGQTATPSATTLAVATSAARIADVAIVNTDELQVTPRNFGSATITVQSSYPAWPGPDNGNVAASEVDRDNDGELDAADGGTGNFGEVPGAQWGQATFRVTVIP